MTSSSTDKYQFLSSRATTTTTTTSSNSRKSHRPPPLSRQNNPSSPRLSKQGLLSPSSKRKAAKTEEQLDMATGFLPFCAMCEKQIMASHSSVLYCSQSCQNQDSRKPLSASSVSLSPTPTPPSSPVLCRSIVPPLEPTKLPHSTSPATTTSTAKSSPRIPDHTYDMTSDLDASDWKRSARRHSAFVDYDTFGFFSRTHRRTHSVPDNNKHNRKSSVASIHGRVPSLCNSPSASPAPSRSPSPTLTHATPATAVSQLEDKHDSTSKHYRPLPPLHKPSFSAGGQAKRGVELVMPQTAVQLVV